MFGVETGWLVSGLNAANWSMPASSMMMNKMFGGRAPAAGLPTQSAPRPSASIQQIDQSALPTPEETWIECVDWNWVGNAAEFKMSGFIARNLAAFAAGLQAFLLVVCPGERALGATANSRGAYLEGAAGYCNRADTDKSTEARSAEMVGTILMVGPVS